MRGVVHQFLTLSDEDRHNKRMLVTMSAGNYGKAFAFVAKEQGMPGVVYMPDHAPLDRKETIEVSRTELEKLRAVRQNTKIRSARGCGLQLIIVIFFLVKRSGNY